MTFNNFQMAKVAVLSPLSKIKTVVTVESEPRALGLSVLKPGTTDYTSFVLLDKKHSFKRRRPIKVRRTTSRTK